MTALPLSATVALAMLLGIPLEYSSDEQDTRSATEARELFGTVVEKTDVQKAPRCLFNSSWGEVVVPEEIAAKYLGLKVHGGVVGSSPGTLAEVQDILDPKTENKQAFCNDWDREQISKPLTEQYDTGMIDKYQVQVTTFGYPVFSEHYDAAIYTTALFAAGRNRIGPSRAKNSYKIAACHYHVMKKEDGTWREVASIQYCES